MDVTFTDGTRERYEDKPLARGAQGSIYRSLDRQSVVKIYAPGTITPDRVTQIDKIIGEFNAVGHDAYWDELFAWPQKRVVAPGMGVRMRFITDLTSMDHFFFKASYDRLAPGKKGWWIGRVAVAIKMARAVTRLSNKGLCHSDLSERNLMVDAFEGLVSVLDCDSLVVPGVLPAQVQGTKEYMAPELTSGRVKLPSVVTDRHALAVLLYRWLLHRHPLVGPKQHDVDPDRDDLLAFGNEALYIEHPTDSSNRPSNLRLTTNALSPKVRDLFKRTFVDALHAPNLRPLPDKWEEALVDMFDMVIPCSGASCAWRFFVAPDSGPLRCPMCNTYVDFPDQIPFLKIRSPQPARGAIQYVDDGLYSRYIVGWPERPIYAWHADPSQRSTPGALGQPPDAAPRAVIRFDASARQWYLENLALPQLQIGVDQGGQVAWQPVPIGKRALLHQNGRLLFGAMDVARQAFVEMRRVR